MAAVTPPAVSPVSLVASTATLSNVASSASSVTIAVANTNRKGIYVYNDSTQTLFLSFSATASSSSYVVQIPTASFWEMPVPPVYTGLITGIWVSANGNARVTELS